MPMHCLARWRVICWHQWQLFDSGISEVGHDRDYLRDSRHLQRRLLACYVRVSTVGQNEAGQRREIERWLSGQRHRRKQRAVGISDKATGDNLDRPGFENLQRDIFQGEVGTVVIWRLDRLSRTMRDGLNTLCDWCDKSLRIVSVSQQIDFNGTIGKMIASAPSGVAEMEQPSPTRTSARRNRRCHDARRLPGGDRRARRRPHPTGPWSCGRADGRWTKSPRPWAVSRRTGDALKKAASRYWTSGFRCGDERARTVNPRLAKPFLTSRRKATNSVASTVLTTNP